MFFSERPIVAVFVKVLFAVHCLFKLQEPSKIKATLLTDRTEVAFAPWVAPATAPECIGALEEYS